MSDLWPWPEDTRIDKLKRIIDSYRDSLSTVDPQACRKLDEKMAAYGEKWISSAEVINQEDLKTAGEFYDLFGPGFEVRNIHMWTYSHPDKIPKRGKVAGRTLFRVGDVLTYQLSLR